MILFLSHTEGDRLAQLLETFGAERAQLVHARREDAAECIAAAARIRSSKPLTIADPGRPGITR